MLSAMAAVRIFAVVLVAFALSLAAQNTSTSRLDITVVDQSGAVVPGAHIGIIQLPAAIPNDGNWRDYAYTAPEQTSTKTDPNGKATVTLTKGGYAVAVSAPGFKHDYEMIDVADESSHSLRATLNVGAIGGPFVVVDKRPGIPLEPTTLTALIPLEPFQAVAVQAHRVRRH